MGYLTIQCDTCESPAIRCGVYEDCIKSLEVNGWQIKNEYHSCPSCKNDILWDEEAGFNLHV